MIWLTRNEKLFTYPTVNRIKEHVDDQVLVIGRNDLIFVFNFNPFDSYTNYGLNVASGDYEIVLNTDNKRFGGFGRIDEAKVFSTEIDETSQQLRLYIPTLTAFVLKKKN
jgi:1,4-alpha-glucan branching enzyme